MKRKIDPLGRIVIPSEMREELGLQVNEQVNIEIKNEKIIISNPATVTIREMLERLIEDNKEKGFVEIDALKKLL